MKLLLSGPRCDEKRNDKENEVAENEPNESNELNNTLDI